ncbi:MAG: glycosyltransferase [Firmicutes bacterium]|nr:glycosyltransferase [Bacillota bacterium]
MIKILFFTETLSAGGAEKVLCDLVDHMDQKQFDITVQTVWPSDPAKYLVPGIRYRAMYPSKGKINILRYRIEAETGLSYRLHIKDDYDIECAYLESGPTKVMSASTNRKAKKLAWVHCDLSRAVKDLAAFEAKTARWYQKFDCVVCVSQRIKEAFDQIFHSSIRSTVVYNVVEDESIRKAAEEHVFGLQKRRLTVLAVGRLCTPKNYPRLLKAHEKLLRSGIEHDLWIVGDGEKRQDLEHFISEHGLSGSVTLFGFQENPYPYMKAADLIVCSSIYEGFSTVITESTILGKAIVTTDCSGMREILGDSEYGLITENSDDAFYDGLKRMLTDPALRKAYAERAALRGQQFSTRELVSKTQVFFQKLVSER